MSPVQWPSSREYVEAIQNPALSFQDPDLKLSTPAVDRLGMPFVTSGQFAYVFKMNSGSGKAQAVRCFRGGVGDREDRYRRINDHLNKVSAPYFASFEYDAQGIMVSGRRYPIQVMEWIGGFPLDVYIPNVLGRADVLKFLTDLWLKALVSLRDSGMAHGDLQHGNIIVDDNNSLRLVDLDGMYVPAMAGWKSAELGHRHYQHPKRDVSNFDATLDNFSGLVIYLSLLSLKDQPSLWTEFHDENLIFTKGDFDNPRGSKLFAKIKAIGADHRRLADALEKACGADPANCPSALDLIAAAPSKLPAWMMQSPTVTVRQPTREVKPGTAPPSGAGGASSSLSGLPGQATPLVGSTSGFPSAPSTFATQTSTRTVAPVSAREVTRLAVTYAFVGVLFIWLWIPLLRLLFVGLGATSQAATWLSVLTYLAACIFLGYRRTRKEATPLNIPSIPVPSTYVKSPSSPRPVPFPKPSFRPRTASSSVSVAQASFVGSKIRSVYHKPTCKWAMKISYRNRVQFRSLADAKAAGYRACGVCSP